MAEAIKNNVKVVIDWQGEGWSGDYDPDEPNDEPLVRFDVYTMVDGEWVSVDDASYCTRLSDNEPESVKQRGAEYLLDEVYDPLTDGYSIKKLCERLSWICVDWLK